MDHREFGKGAPELVESAHIPPLITMKSGRFYVSNTVPYLAIRLHNNGNRVVNIRDLVRPLARSKNIEAVSLHSNYDFQQSKIASQHAYHIFYLGIPTPFPMSKGKEL